MNSPETKRVKVLLIEDDTASARLVRAYLADSAGVKFEMEWADHLAAGLELLARGGFDVVLLDMSLPDSHGLETFTRVHAAAPQVPVVIMSGLDDEALEVRTVHEGAQEYLVKGDITAHSLQRAIRYAIERQHIEEALASEQHLLRSLIDNMPDLIFIKDTEGRFMLVNKTLAGMVGEATPEAMIGKTDFDYSPKELAEHYQADDAAIRQSGKLLLDREELHVDVTGKKRWISTTKVPLRDSKGGVIGVVGIARDITARRQAEEALRVNEERTRQIIETANDAFVEMDESGRITDWNRQAEKTFGWRREEVIGRTVGETIIPPQFREQHARGLAHLRAAGDSPVMNKPIEIVALHRDGHQFPVELTVWPLRHDDRMRFNAFVRDITARKRAEEEIADKNAEIQRDLQIAREFQEAMLPRDYPEIAGQSASGPLRLAFQHFYKPTLTVGGDFFDVVQLSDHRAGVFIADVMGHGARSALVTAILRTLWTDLARQIGDPAQFLAALNEHFSGIIQRADEFLFTSAFYLILDTQQAQAIYATAGHPSPLLADRVARTVRPLVERVEGNPALGLFSNATYTQFTRPIKADEIFLLFTDGIVEAPNARSEEFGRERLCRVIQENLDDDLPALTQHVIQSLNQFIGAATLPDDICLVAAEVTAARAATARDKAACRMA